MLVVVQPDYDVHIVVAPGWYHGHQTVWTYANPPYRIRFEPPDNATGRVIFDGQLVDGSYPGGTWFRLNSSAGADTNLDFRNLHIINYWDAISLMGDRNDPAGWNGNNRIEECTFERIGNTFNPSLPPSTAAIRFVNSKQNIVYNNDFIDVVNMASGELIHAIYAAHMADFNLISRNRFVNHSGDPVRVRDFSTGNYVDDNFHIQAGNYGYSEWYCDHDVRGDCTKASPECPSWYNEYRNNYLVSRYDGGTLSVFRFFQDYVSGLCEEPVEDAWRLRTSGNVQIGFSEASSWHLWLHRNYDRATRDAGEVTGPFDIPDDDNVSNLTRYALGIGGRPSRPEDLPRIQQNESGEIQVVWPEDPEADRAQIELQYSTDLTGWMEAGWEDESVANDGWGRTVRTVVVPKGLGDSLFLRLRILLE